MDFTLNTSKKNSYFGQNKVIETGRRIYPSYWADFLSKVAEVTLLPVTHIWHRMSYACALQYVMVWNYRQGSFCVPFSRSKKKFQLSQPL
jgi:hypothetical protein